MPLDIIIIFFFGNFTVVKWWWGTLIFAVETNSVKKSSHCRKWVDERRKKRQITENAPCKFPSTYTFKVSQLISARTHYCFWLLFCILWCILHTVKCIILWKNSIFQKHKLWSFKKLKTSCSTCFEPVTKPIRH